MKKKQKWIAATAAGICAALLLSAMLLIPDLKGGGEKAGGQKAGGAGGGEGAITEEQKAQIEEQTGVTVREDGAVEVNIGEIMEEEASVPVSREEAGEIITEEAGEGYSIENITLTERQGKYYWAAQASKGNEDRLIWIDAETGGIFANQKE